MARKQKNYLNNADLLIEVIKSKEQDRMTDKMAKMIMLLADRYGTKPNYNGYSFLEDMKAYAVMCICNTWRSFNPEKSRNPFAFYTECVKNSFNHYLNKESDHRRLRDDMLILSGYNPSSGYGNGEDKNDSTNSYDD